MNKNIKDFEIQRELIGYGTHGSCGWDLDREGTLTIRPLNGSYGVLKNQNELGGRTPWGEFNSQISKVVVEQGVHANFDVSNLFAHMHNCKEMDLSGLDTSNTRNMENMFYNCSSLEKVKGSLDTRNVDVRFNMFSYCFKLRDHDFMQSPKKVNPWIPPGHSEEKPRDKTFVPYRDFLNRKDDKDKITLTNIKIGNKDKIKTSDEIEH